MTIVLVTDSPDEWQLDTPDLRIVAARDYISNPEWNALTNARVFNLCRSYSYQSIGYYVSLLAEARGHKPQPDVTTIQDLKSNALVRVISDDLDSLIQRTLRSLRSTRFELSIYFGRTFAKRDISLGLRLFELFRSPLLRATFQHNRGKWRLQGLRPIALNEVPLEHWEFLLESAALYFRRRQWGGGQTPPRYNLAVLVEPNEKDPPSNKSALERLGRAGARVGMNVEFITRDDFERLPMYDALFIRTMTAVNHYTYRFARRARAEGMPVIDDPLSMARCCNKVFQTERLTAAKVPIPPTVIVHRDNLNTVVETLGLPIVLKKPDSAFSLGVRKVNTPEEFKAHAKELLDQSALFIAQAFTPTDYDWRVGVLDGQPIFVCRYYMARSHWQIMNHHTKSGKTAYGKFDTLLVEEARPKVVRTAVRAARLIGDGLYGVDLKQVGRQVCVIEVNDNPNLDSGIEDLKLKDQLYDRVIHSFIRRIERLRQEPRTGRTVLDTD